MGVGGDLVVGRGRDVGRRVGVGVGGRVGFMLGFGVGSSCVARGQNTGSPCGEARTNLQYFCVWLVWLCVWKYILGKVWSVFNSK